MIKPDRGAVKRIDKVTGVIRLDNDQTYRCLPADAEAASAAAMAAPEQQSVALPDWLAIGGHVAVTYDDENGKRDVIEIGKA